MIRSMTGYGEAEVQIPEGHLRATVKTVNHRFFNPHLRTPPGFDRFESDLQQWLKAHFSRGHVNLSLVFERDRAPGTEGLPELDLDRARHYGALLEQLREGLDLPGPVEMASILRFNDIFRSPDVSVSELSIDPSGLKALVDAAAEAAVAMRAAEGARLEDDLVGRLEALEENLALVEARAPHRLEAERDRLRAAIAELAVQDEVDDDRLAKELAYLAERWDINEEIVRFKAHLLAFRDTLDSGDDTPVGKRLGFLVQEMHREANTIASKANDLEIGHASVAIREEIERLREQLENVE